MSTIETLGQTNLLASDVVDGGIVQVPGYKRGNSVHVQSEDENRLTGSRTVIVMLCMAFVFACLICQKSSAATIHALTALQGQSDSRPLSVSRAPGGTITGIAKARVDRTDRKTATSRKVVGATGSIPLAFDDGFNNFGASVAHAYGDWTVGRVPLSALVLINMSGEAAVIQGNERAPTGFAEVIFDDPLVYVDAGGETFEQTYRLQSGMVLQAPSLNASSTIEWDAGSNISGFENFFDLTISLTGALGGRAPIVEFTSDPVFGIDDLVVEQQIASSLVFQPTRGSYSLASDLIIFSEQVAVPLTQSVVEFDWNGRAESVVTPEPSSIVTIVMSVAGMAICGRVNRSNRKCG